MLYDNINTQPDASDSLVGANVVFRMENEEMKKFKGEPISVWVFMIIPLILSFLALIVGLVILFIQGIHTNPVLTIILTIFTVWFVGAMITLFSNSNGLY